VSSEGEEMVDADHYSWEEVYDLLGCESGLEPIMEF
jgi:hypothetical protein